MRHKLLLVVVVTTLAALLITGASLMYYDLRTYQHTWEGDLLTQAEILGSASAAALAFDDSKTAAGTLSLLKARPQISAAAIYNAKGVLFARYLRSNAADFRFPALPEADGPRLEGDDLVVYRRIVENGEIVGTVYLRAQYDLFERIKDYLRILSVVLALSLLVALLVSSWLHAVIIKPITAITRVTREIMETRDFTLRARKMTEDEIGYLVDGFNDMLDEIGRQSDGLQKSNQSLEHEIVERRSAEEALRDSERRHRTLISAMTSVVWTTDGRGRFVERQPSWQDYTGQNEKEYSTLGWRTAFEAQDRSTIDLAWARAMSAAEMFELELQLWHQHSGRYRYVSMRAVPIIDAAGSAHEWIGTVTDIDDQRRAEGELRKLNTELERRVTDRTAELQAANKELESFSYSVSHDLRAPVRAVAGFSKLLWEAHSGQFDAEARRKLDIIRSEAQRMTVLIDDLLAFSRLGRQAIKKVNLDMQVLAQSMFDRLQAQHQGPKAEFRLGSVPHADGDRVLLEQVWANFLSNALKFSSKRDHPVIEVGAISEDTEHVYFVRDNGAGFNPRYQAKLFGVFQRLHDATEFPGTGVGLALVQRIVNRHGGRVWADSKPGEGATFYFTLPKELPHGRS